MRRRRRWVESWVPGARATRALARRRRVITGSNAPEDSVMRRDTGWFLAMASA